MKPIFISFLLFFFYQSNGQIPLDSFYKDNTRWADLYYCAWSSSSSSTTKSTTAYEYKIIGDTVLNTVSYKKIYRRDIYGKSSSGNTYTSDTFMYIGRLRTDHNTKVFFTDDRYGVWSPYTIGQEKMIYDFGLTVGDTLVGGRTITSIDTITTISGHKIKKYNYYSSYILEGIGSAYGFLGSAMIRYGPGPTCGNINLCYESGNMSYKSGAEDPHNLLNWYLLENCYDINMLNTTEPALPAKLTVFPNPVSNTINLKGSIAGKEAKIALYNSMGQIVYSTLKEIVNNNLQTTLKIPALAHGVYNLIVTTEKTCSTTRILVE